MFDETGVLNLPDPPRASASSFARESFASSTMGSGVSTTSALHWWLFTVTLQRSTEAAALAVDAFEDRHCCRVPRGVPARFRSDSSRMTSIVDTLDDRRSAEGLVLRPTRQRSGQLQAGKPSSPF